MQRMVSQLNAPYCRISIESSTGAFDDERGAVEPWGRLSKGQQLKSRLGQTPVGRLYRSSASGSSFAVLTVPLRDRDRRVCGTATMVIPCDSHTVLRARLDEMAAVLALVHELSNVTRTSASSDATQARSDLTRIAKSTEYGSIQEFAFAFANTLKTKLDCEQVSLGIARGASIQLLCISGSDVLYPRAPGAAVIVHAMQECLDAQQVTCFQLETVRGKGGGHTGHRLHREWHESVAQSCVASIPLVLDGRCVAVLGLRRRVSEPFSSGELQRVVEMASPLSTGLLLLDRGHRSLIRHFADDIREEVPRWLGRQGRGRRIAFMAVIAFGVWFAFAKKDYEVTVSCTVHPLEQRTLAAPFEGVIAAQHVEPGERVVAGQLLVEMETRELRVRREELLAEVEVASVERSHATALGDMAAAAQSHARWKAATARLAVVDWRIQQSQIRATSDGVILEGELAHRVGQTVPLGDPLLEFSDAQHWRVELEVPEYLAPLMETAQPGTFAAVARPDIVTPCEIQTIHATAHRKHAKNYFVARASITGTPPNWMRAGMEGVARVNVGRHRVWWISLHRLIGALQLHIWKW